MPSAIGPTWAGFMTPIFSLISLACFVALGFAVLSLVSTGPIVMSRFPVLGGMPTWAGLLILVVLFHVITSPIRAARHASRLAWGRHYAWFAMWDGLFATGVVVLGLWLLFRHMPPVEDFGDFMQHVPEAARGAWQELVGWVQNLVERPR